MSYAEQLLKVQDYDCRIRDMKQEMKDIPARKEQEVSRLNAHKNALAESEEKLKEK